MTAHLRIRGARSDILAADTCRYNSPQVQQPSGLMFVETRWELAHRRPRRECTKVVSTVWHSSLDSTGVWAQGSIQ